MKRKDLPSRIDSSRNLRADIGRHWVYREEIVPAGKPHEGERAVIVVLVDAHLGEDDGFMGLGIHPDRQEAEREAVADARATRNRWIWEMKIRNEVRS